MTDDIQPSAAPSLDPPRAPEGSAAAGEKTRASLIRVALDLFGRKGYDATSTRDIAGAAGVNIAGIAYHFGGKAGLHKACGELVAGFLGERLGILTPGDPATDDALSADEAAALFEASISDFARFILSRPEAEAIARFMVREQMDPTATFEILYHGLIRPRHERLCRLWGRATGEDPASEGVIITVSALFGQVLFFRVGRATALRRLGWADIDATNVEKIVETVRESTRAMLASRRAGRDPS
ncbi:CerR family C-terminal domain-containing protein [Pinisolibacter aquiterrae]|uniref:CerR family C-terminal domain-containing protein n=1 Tax=Pinisolibacter aquiterrae TaxID=2815579 RepID=UPI001C3D85DC|nr:CerR family C-terminal domain-containing protein [Pinisolibacter aquiterrae]MBV5264775.1 CerR family C-terminal domain-containing protein [Pinisolibacter aquiterrae]MCC8234194.1 CerR family C-terminal domain-containing protein [Pinisolibacter aquiterrae]